MTTITREQALKIIEAADEVISALAGTNEDVHPGSDNMLRLWDDLNDRYAPPEVVRELARIALASLEAEPVSQTYKLTFEQWLEQQHDKIDVDCGCVSTEMFMHWIRVAYEAGNSPVTPDGWISCSEQMPDDGRIQFSVSLPAACGGDKYFIDGVFQPLRYERDCEKAVVAAGGVVNWVK